MKVAIFGFDGLEYNLVERFRLKNIKQKQYGKITIPKECYIDKFDLRGEKIYEPWTPFVWSAFLSGKNPAEIGLSKGTLKKWENPLLQFLRVLSMKVGLDRIKNKRIILEKLGFKRTSFSIEDYKHPTIFDYAHNPCAINVPTVSKSWELALEGKEFDEMLRISWRRFYKVRDETLRAVKKGDWDLLMGYTRLLDTVGELCFGNFKELFKAYTVCNRFVGEFKRYLDDNTVCLIVSDHGMERFGNTPYGKHSDYGFYSLNIVTDWRPKTTYDFFDQIVKWLAE